MKKRMKNKDPLQSPETELSIEKLPVSSHYIDNKKFYSALVDYKNLIDEASVRGEIQPQVPDYIGDCFIKIATHLSYKSNFINYTFKDDMISDGIENCLTAVAKFDPSKSSNPFAYYTQIIYYAFVRRIQKEKKQQATKYKMLENVDIETLIAHSDGNEEFANSLVEMVRKQVDLIDEDRRTIKPTKKKKETVEDVDLEL